MYMGGGVAHTVYEWIQCFQSTLDHWKIKGAPFIWNEKNLLEHLVYGYKEIYLSTLYTDRAISFKHPVYGQDNFIRAPCIWMGQFNLKTMYMDGAILFQHQVYGCVNFISASLM